LEDDGDVNGEKDEIMRWMVDVDMRMRMRMRVATSSRRDQERMKRKQGPV
jgi:hypothetical protein